MSAEQVTVPAPEITFAAGSSSELRQASGMFKTRLFSIVLLALNAFPADSASAAPDDIQRPDQGKKIKVFLCAGLSSMEGRADGMELTRLNRERLERAQPRVQLAFNREPLRALDVVKPSNEIARLYERDLIFGPELFFRDFHC